MIRIVKRDEVEQVLKNKKRAYYSGSKLMFEGIDYIQNDGLEIAITEYKDFTSDRPHFHEWNEEYNLVIEGEIKVFLIDSQEEFTFKKHDMYMIEPKTKYMAKAEGGTVIVVVKLPGGNDKRALDYGSEYEERWNSEWEVKSQ